MKKVKFETNLEHEYIHNFQLVKIAFSALGVQKVWHRLTQLSLYWQLLKLVRWFQLTGLLRESSRTTLNSSNGLRSSLMQTVVIEDDIMMECLREEDYPSVDPWHLCQWHHQEEWCQDSLLNKGVHQHHPEEEV